MSFERDLHAVPIEARRARLATYALLFANGLAQTSWIVHLPSIMAATGVNEVQIGIAISAVGVGSIIFIVVMGWILSRFGTRISAAIALAFFGIAFPGIGLAWDFGTFATSLFLAGAGSAMVEVAASTSASRLEHAYRRPMMPSFIGSMAVGSVAGTLVGAASIQAGVPVIVHLAAVGLVIWLVGAYAVPRLLAAEVDRTVGRRVRHWPRFSWRLVAISALILVSVVEGGALAFSTLYMTQDLGTSPAFAAFSVTAYSIGTAVAQLAGDRLRRRYSAAILVRATVVLGGGVLVAALLVADPWFALVGFFAIGAGIAFVYPAGISAAADTQPTPAPGVAAAQTVRYVGSFGAAPLVGVLIASNGLTSTFYMMVAFGIALTLLLGGALGRHTGLGTREGGELPDLAVSGSTGGTSAPLPSKSDSESVAPD